MSRQPNGRTKVYLFTEAEHHQARVTLRNPSYPSTDTSLRTRTHELQPNGR
jgi:hypothetical protein